MTLHAPRTHNAPSYTYIEFQQLGQCAAAWVSYRMLLLCFSKFSRQFFWGLTAGRISAVRGLCPLIKTETNRRCLKFSFTFQTSCSVSKPERLELRVGSKTDGKFRTF